MIETIVIILAMLGCIGLGVLLGWVLWGSEARYYKSLFESYSKTSKTGYGIPPLINIKK